MSPSGSTICSIGKSAASSYGDAVSPISDPRYPLAEVFRLNSEFYTPGKPDAAAYGRQPMEGHARVLDKYKEQPEDERMRQRPREAFWALWR
jgi:hypothetical protein